MLCSVVTKNSNWQDGQEEDNIGWKRMINLNIFLAHGKIWVLVEGLQKTNRRDCLKGLGQFAGLRGSGLARKR